MHVLITGSSGLIGSRLSQNLTDDGHSVIRLVRTPSPAAATVILWNPDAEATIQTNALEGLDAVVHLAGENIAGRWTPEKKARIRNSRVRGTKLLAHTLAQLKSRPRVFLCASAIGYYGDTGDQEVDERQPHGDGFLSNVCHTWEEATRPAEEAGIRTLQARFGMVLDEQGGALNKMLPFFKKGLGGIVGNGKQVYSWISSTDTVRAIRFLISKESIAGPVNLVSPHAVTNRVFTKALGAALGKPTPFPLPEFLTKMVFGEMGEELLLSSANVKPGVLMEQGFEFEHATIEKAFAGLL